MDYYRMHFFVLISFAPQTLIVLKDEQPVNALLSIVSKEAEKTRFVNDEHPEKQFSLIMRICDGNCISDSAVHYEYVFLLNSLILLLLWNAMQGLMNKKKLFQITI